ncbi:MAG: substrate-binding domain-containing protein [Eubacteriales bacterium]|nr:substrate-binding domain-containing protein [Eubacteriales bacterium]
MNGVAITIMILEAIAIGVLVFLLVRNNKSSKKIMDNAQQIVNGKLDVDDIRISGAETNSTVVAGAFNAIKSNLMTFVESTKGNVTVLSDAIDVLSNSVDANQEANEQIADGVTSVAVKAGEQLELVRDNLKIIENNNIHLADIQHEMNRIENVLNDTVEQSQKGTLNLEGYKKDVAAVSDGLASVHGVLEDFNHEIAQIEEVGDFIIDVSEQLMLLAFNASIEAARAGEAGKGFAVVADEMNEMSVKTKEGMGTINQIVNEIKESSALINECIQNCDKTFGESRNTFELVNESFGTISVHATDVQEKMGDISKRFGEISRNSDASKKKATNLYDASVSISDSTHEIAAASEMTAAESSQIAHNVEELRGMLVGIQNLLKQFNTAVVPVEKDRANKVKILVLSMLDNDFWYGVRRGVNYAIQELSVHNADVEFIPCMGDTIDQNVTMAANRCVSEKIDALVLPGFLAGENPLIKKAVGQGTKVFTFNCDCSSEIGRLACFSPDSKEAGMMAAKSIEKQMNKNANVGMIYGDETVPGYRDRKAGFMEYLERAKGIKVVNSIQVKDSEEDAYQAAMKLLRDNPEMNVIYYITGTPLAVAKAIEDSKKVGKVSLVCFDHNKEIFDYIKKGVILASVGQDAFGQGHDPIIWAYNHIVTGQVLPAEIISCRSSVVDKDNVNNLIEA